MHPGKVRSDCQVFPNRSSLITVTHIQRAYKIVILNGLPVAAGHTCQKTKQIATDLFLSLSSPRRNLSILFLAVQQDLSVAQPPTPEDTPPCAKPQATAAGQIDCPEIFSLHILSHIQPPSPQSPPQQCNRAPDADFPHPVHISCGFRTPCLPILLYRSGCCVPDPNSSGHHLLIQDQLLPG